MNPKESCSTYAPPKQSAYDRNMDKTFYSSSEMERAAMDIFREDGKIHAIKFWRNRTACGLKEAKETVERIIETGTAEGPIMEYNGEIFERTDKIFDLQNLVADCACPEGLIGVLKHFGHTIYGNGLDGIGDLTFRLWFIEKGSSHTTWLVNHGYLKVKRTPKQITEEAIQKIYDQAGWWASGDHDSKTAMERIDAIIKEMKEELRRK